MKKMSVFVILLLMASFAMTGCKDTAKQSATPAEQQDSVADSTLYGVCGEATTMHELELLTDAGDTLMLGIQENDEGTQDVKGGLLAGDRLAVIASDIDGEKVASRVINLTTLQGHWTSLDKISWSWRTAPLSRMCRQRNILGLHGKLSTDCSCSIRTRSRSMS